MPRSGPPQPRHIPQRRGQQDQHLEQKPLVRPDRQRFLEIGIGRPADRQRQREPRQPPRLERQDCHRQHRQPDRYPLPPAQPLAQQHRPQKHRKQRVDVIAQRRIQRVPRPDGPDIDPPVDADDRRSHRGHPQHPRISDRRPQIRRPALKQQDQPRNRHRPDHPMRDHLGRRDMRHRLHEQRQEPPHKIRRQRKAEPARRVLVGRLHRTLRPGQTADLTQRAGRGQCYLNMRPITAAAPDKPG